MLRYYLFRQNITLLPYLHVNYTTISKVVPFIFTSNKAFDFSVKRHYINNKISLDKSLIAHTIQMLTK